MPGAMQALTEQFLFALRWAMFGNKAGGCGGGGGGGGGSGCGGGSGGGGSGVFGLSSIAVNRSAVLFEYFSSLFTFKQCNLLLAIPYFHLKEATRGFYRYNYRYYNKWSLFIEC